LQIVSVSIWKYLSIFKVYIMISTCLFLKGTSRASFQKTRKTDQEFSIVVISGKRDNGSFVASWVFFL
jgi:hypothetical protein